MSVAVATRGSAVKGSTVTVTLGSPGAAVNQRLRGSLHPFGFPNAPSAAMRTQNIGVGTLERTDKFLTVTPIKAGAVDGAHPTLGVSGLYSYDWRVVDRSMAEITGQGLEPYISIDGCPSILGGSVSPYSGSDLTGVNVTSPQYGLAGYASYGPELPNNLTAYSHMVADLIHHITVTLGVSVPRWGVWNEPDGGQFFIDPATGVGGTPAQYFALYAAVANAVKGFNPALKVGGPEVVLPTESFTGWIQGLLSYCKTNSVPLDFLSIHDYYNTYWTLQTFSMKLAAAKTSVGWTTPLEVVVGEWGSGPGWRPPFGTAPDITEINDQAGAAVALELMEMQRLGVALAVFFKSGYELGAPGEFGGGLVSSSGCWTVGNVFKLWARMATANVLPTTLDADPGIHAMAAVDPSGKVYVLVSSFHYRRGPKYMVTVSIPGIADGRVVTATVIDQTHSNQLDAGLSHAELETVPVSNVIGGKVRVTLAARAVALFEIAP